MNAFCELLFAIWEHIGVTKRCFFILQFTADEMTHVTGFIVASRESGAASGWFRQVYLTIFDQNNQHVNLRGFSGILPEST